MKINEAAMKNVIYFWRFRIHIVIMRQICRFIQNFFGWSAKMWHRHRRFLRSVRIVMYSFLYDHAVKFKWTPPLQIAPRKNTIAPKLNSHKSDPSVHDKGGKSQLSRWEKVGRPSTTLRELTGNLLDGNIGFFRSLLRLIRGNSVVANSNGVSVEIGSCGLCVLSRTLPSRPACLGI